MQNLELTNIATKHTQMIKTTVSIGICAYNEGKNIGKLLESINKQRSSIFKFDQIVVISSACTDDTESITEYFAKYNDKIQLVKQQNREGKASAINCFLEVADSNICVLVSADTILRDSNTLELLCTPLLQSNVGITGGHPIPIDDPRHFMGFICHLIWTMAHELSLIQPKLGEIIAFKNSIVQIPVNTAVDESCLESKFSILGYVAHYVPESVIYNKGPSTISDFIKQRRRIYCGHTHLKKHIGYKVSSLNFARLLVIVTKTLRPNWRSILWTPLAIFLEVYARLLGVYDFYLAKNNPYIWEISRSTKNLVNNGFSTKEIVRSYEL
jgi:poly-beta-1,6-N-acetyl-D-glucosamine synthase